MSDSLRILVIEDSANHRQSAVDTLIGHTLTIVDSYDKAMELMEEAHWDHQLKTMVEDPFPFDVVLTDMMMPMSTKTLVPEAYNAKEQVPYGLIIALKAASRGAKFVAMLTDTNHHKGAMSAALDCLGPAYYASPDRSNWYDAIKVFNMNGAKVVFVHAPFVKNEFQYERNAQKDWGLVLKDFFTACAEPHPTP